MTNKCNLSDNARRFLSQYCSTGWITGSLKWSDEDIEAIVELNRNELITIEISGISQTEPACPGHSSRTQGNELSGKLHNQDTASNDSEDT